MRAGPEKIAPAGGGGGHLLSGASVLSKQLQSAGPSPPRFSARRPGNEIFIRSWLRIRVRSCRLNSLYGDFCLESDLPATDEKHLPGPSGSKLSQFVEPIPFVLVHVLCLAAIWTGVGIGDLLIAVGLYGIRMFAITAGYHRYFSHRSFKTGRIFACVLAFLAQTSAQRGVLWWAGHHRQHHRRSDSEGDPHSPLVSGFWHAHVGWIFAPAHQESDLESVADLAKYPELLWLDRHPYLPAFLMGFAAWLLAGWSGLVVGFFWSTVALWHATFSINSLAHVIGRKRYVTGDQSRNNLWLALLTFGEGWHNNHHHYQSAACQGFRRYEVDVTYYILKALSALGLVWGLRRPPAHVVSHNQRLRREVLEKAAGQLAASYRVEHIVAELEGQMRQLAPNLYDRIEDLRTGLVEFFGNWGQQWDDKVARARRDLDELISTLHLSEMPSKVDLIRHASAMFAATPSMNDIVERSRQKLLDRVLAELLGQPRALQRVSL